MRYLAEESLLKRAQSTQLERLRYHCPPRLADHPTVPATLHSHLNNNCFILVTKVAKTEVSFMPQDIRHVVCQIGPFTQTAQKGTQILNAIKIEIWINFETNL